MLFNVINLVRTLWFYLVVWLNIYSWFIWSCLEINHFSLCVSFWGCENVIYMRTQCLCAVILWKEMFLPSFYVQICLGEMDWKLKIQRRTGWNWRSSSRRDNGYKPGCLILFLEGLSELEWGGFELGVCSTPEPALCSPDQWWAWGRAEPARLCPSSKRGQGLDRCLLLRVPGLPDLLEMLKKHLVRLAGSRLEGVMDASLLSWDLRRARQERRHGTRSEPKRLASEIRAARQGRVLLQKGGFRGAARGNCAAGRIAPTHSRRGQAAQTLLPAQAQKLGAAPRPRHWLHLHGVSGEPWPSVQWDQNKWCSSSLTAWAFHHSTFSLIPGGRLLWAAGVVTWQAKHAGLQRLSSLLPLRMQKALMFEHLF